MQQRYAVAVGPVGATCSTITYFGKGTGDEKVFCTSAENDDDNGCNIFSIGSNDNWGFESEVLQKLPGCKTHTFDCTLPDNIPKKKPTTVDVAFYPFCIGSNDSSEGSYRSYQSLVTETNIKSPPKCKSLIELLLVLSLCSNTHNSLFSSIEDGH